MKKYSYLVNRHFKVHIKRGILTIIGIISSIILFFTISYLNNYVDYINLIEGKERWGDYDIAIKDIDGSTAEKIINNIKVYRGGMYNLKSRDNIQVGRVTKSLMIYSLDNGAMVEIFNRQLVLEEGVLPKNSGELILPYRAKEQLNLKLGDITTVNGAEYKIVGFYKEVDHTTLSILNGVTFLEEGNNLQEIGVVFSIKGSSDKYKNLQAIIEDVGLEYKNLIEETQIKFNRNILKNKRVTNGDVNVELNDQVLGVIGLNISVLILTIILTYGSINISLNERKKQFSTLRCIGATPAKIKGLLIKESITLGLFSIVPGIIIAQIISWVITDGIISRLLGVGTYGVKGKIFYNVMVNTILFIIVNIFIATIIPLRKAEKIAPIEVIKPKEVKNKSVRRKKARSIRKIFGYTGELAYRNIRANHKKFIITTVTLVVLFVVITVLGGYRVAAEEYYNEKILNLKDISIDVNFEKKDQDNTSVEQVMEDSEEFIDGLKALNVSSEIYTSIKTIGSGILTGTSLNKSIAEAPTFKNLIFKDEEAIYSNSIILLALDKEYLEKITPYINGGDSNIDKFNKDDFIVIDSKSPQNILKSKSYSYLSAKPGDKIGLNLFINEKLGNTQEVRSIEMNYLGTIDSYDLINTHRFGYYTCLTIIVSEEFLEENKESISNIDRSYLNIAMDIDKTQNKDIVLEEINRYANKYNAYYLQEKDIEEEFQKKIELKFILVYLGLTLIVVISIINIINNKSINISLRMEEFGALLAIGMKKAELKKMVILEDLIEWGISSFIGGSISIIIIKIINIYYGYMGNLETMPSTFYLVIINIIGLLIITLITNMAAYRKIKDLKVNDLIISEE